MLRNLNIIKYQSNLLIVMVNNFSIYDNYNNDN